MAFLLDKCKFQKFDNEILLKCKEFDCSHKDLNEFFKKDIINYSSTLLGKSYCFTLEENPSEIVCAFTLSNDSIKTKDLPQARKQKVAKEIPQPKRMRTYPAVLIGRLGVSKKYRAIEGESLKTSTQLMDFIKSFFLTDVHFSGCRFLVVDSYNEVRPLEYYTNNGFVTLFSTIEQEKEFTGLKENDTLNTRLMYFDLITLKTLN